MNLNYLEQNVWIFILLAVWELAWKGYALYLAAKSSQKYWFIAILIINTAGILPIIYLFLNHKDKLSKNEILKVFQK